MSGGHFDYKQYHINDIVEELEKIIRENNSEEKNEYGDNIGYKFSDKTISEFKEGLHYLKIAQLYAQRIDWLVSGDDGEESFQSRLRQELKELK